MKLALFVTAAAMTITVCTAPAHGVTVRVPLDQPTIQQGIDAASAGDTVLVAPGTYTGALNRDLDFGGVNVVLESESGAGVTFIDCQSLGRGFFFHSGEDTTAVVRGFTITGAVADSGGGAFCRGGSSPRFELCTFTGCSATAWGGGVCIYASSPVIRGCEFVGNEASDAGGRGGSGGGLACFWYGYPLIVDCEFRGNDVGTSGGGAHVYFAGPQFTRCLFQENTGAEYVLGAGVSLTVPEGVVLTECEFRGNGVATGNGGGVYVTGGEVDLTDCLFIDNIAGAAGGMCLSDDVVSTVSGCTFLGNRGYWTAAGGVYCSNSAGVTITGCTFADNRQNHVWCHDADPVIDHCILAFTSGGAPVSCFGTSSPTIHHCFVYGNAGGDTLCGSFSDIEYVNPLFCDLEADDVTLCADSPCLPGVTWPTLVGSQPQGCAECGSAVEGRRWGAIKAMYR